MRITKVFCYILTFMHLGSMKIILQTSTQVYYVHLTFFELTKNYFVGAAIVGAATLP